MRNRMSWYAPVPLRLALGAGFIYHGFPKVFTAAGHTQFVGMLTDLGIPAPEAMAWLVGIVESIGGVMLLAGFATWIAAAVLLVDMIVAMAAVHWPAGFSFMNIVGQSDTGPIFGMPGYEVNLLYIAGLLSLILSGPGAWSLAGRRTWAEEQAAREDRQTVIRAEPESVPFDIDRERTNQ